MDILSIVISVGAAAVVSAVIHQFGKKEDSLERVRRYAEGQIGRFDEYFKRKKEAVDQLDAMRCDFIHARCHLLHSDYLHGRHR